MNIKTGFKVALLGFALSGFIVAMQTGTSSANSETQPPEAGKVSWIRDYEKGLALAKKADKPMLLMFQEIPG